MTKYLSTGGSPYALTKDDFVNTNGDSLNLVATGKQGAGEIVVNLPRVEILPGQFGKIFVFIANDDVSLRLNADNTTDIIAVKGTPPPIDTIKIETGNLFASLQIIGQYGDGGAWVMPNNVTYAP